MSQVALSLGSNLGDRLGYLQSACQELSKILSNFRVSEIYVTTPIGGPAQGDFLNAVAVGTTQLQPLELLQFCQEIESANARTRDQRWGPRTLDVDILAIDNLNIDIVNGHEQFVGSELHLPHPRAHERAFVLVPWSTLEPSRVLYRKQTVGELAATVERTGVDVYGVNLNRDEVSG